MPRIRKSTKKTTISCTSCRTRKRKCDGNVPCETCVLKSIECHYVDVDRRRKRPQASYVEALEASNTKHRRLIDALRENLTDHDSLVKLLSMSDLPVQQEQEQEQEQEQTPRIAPTVQGQEQGETSVQRHPHPQQTLESQKEPKHHRNFDHVLVSSKTGSTPMVLGPTSVYNDDMIIDKTHHDPETLKSHYQKIQDILTPEQLKELVLYRVKYGHQTYKLFYFKPKDHCIFPMFKDCMSLFFKWMYSSSFFFIHRESFLYFFLSNEINCEFVSIELIYAISALGARISQDKHTKSQADEFYNISKKTVFGSGDDKYFMRDSNICKLQTLLCLALYDLGRGELTSCWLLSGLAFRVGHDFGFELDPKNWNVTSPTPISSDVSTPSSSQFSYMNQGINSTSVLDVGEVHTGDGLDNGGQSVNEERDRKKEKDTLYKNYPFDIRQLRSRIYWGSCVADRLISLVMGRTATLKLADVTIPETQDIGDLTGMEEFIFYDNRSDKQYACRGYHCLKAAVELLSISDDILKKVFGTHIKKGITRLQALSDSNLRLLQWKEGLGKELFWNKSILKRTAHNELYMGPRYVYFIIMLSINRPFVSMAALGSFKSMNIEIAKMPVQICDDVVDDLEIVIKSITSQENSHKAFCPHISSVYSIILALSVLLWRFKIDQTYKSKQVIAQKLDLFFGFLEKCQDIWPLAARPVTVFRRRINELWSDYKEEPVFLQPTPNSNFLNYQSGNDLHLFEYPNSSNYDGLGFDMENHDVEQMFQSIFEEPSNQQLFNRLDLADALWDEGLYDTTSELS